MPYLASIRIAYTLSDKGQKASLLSGGDGKRLQIVEVPATAELLEKAVLRFDGSPWIYLSHHFSNSELEVLGLPVPTLHSNGRHIVCARRFGSVDEHTFKVTLEERLYDRASYDFDAPLEDPAGYVVKIPRMNKIERRKAVKRASRLKHCQIMQKRKEMRQNQGEKGKGEGKGDREAEADDRVAEETAKREALVRVETRRQDRDKWIREHGSARLKKLLEAELLDSDPLLYDRERIVFEMGEGWELWVNHHMVDKNVTQPPEYALDALLDERACRLPDFNPRLVKAHKSSDLYTSLWAILMTVLWEKSKGALKFIDLPVVPETPQAVQKPKREGKKVLRKARTGRKRRGKR